MTRHHILGVHIVAYTTRIKGNNLTKSKIESVLVTKLGETFTKRSLSWHFLLPETSIGSFAKLAKTLSRLTLERKNLKNESKISSKYNKDIMMYSENSLVDSIES